MVTHWCSRAPLFAVYLLVTVYTHGVCFVSDGIIVILPQLLLVLVVVSLPLNLSFVVIFVRICYVSLREHGNTMTLQCSHSDWLIHSSLFKIVFYFPQTRLRGMIFLICNLHSMTGSMTFIMVPFFHHWENNFYTCISVFSFRWQRKLLCILNYFVCEGLIVVCSFVRLIISSFEMQI